MKDPWSSNTRLLSPVFHRMLSFPPLLPTFRYFTMRSRRSHLATVLSQSTEFCGFRLSFDFLLKPMMVLLGLRSSSLILTRLEGLWTEAFDMASGITENTPQSTHDGVATLRRSFKGVRGDG